MNLSLLFNFLAVSDDIFPTKNKLILASLMARYGLGSEPVILKITDTANECGYGRNQLNETLKLGVREGLILRTRCTDGQYVSVKRYQLSDEFYHYLNDHSQKFELLDRVIEPIISELLRVAIPFQKGQEQDVLRADGRLVLIVLLLFSDRYGVVRELPQAKIRKLTGMTKESLRSYLKKLAGSGYISRITPGGVVKVLGKMSSRYNLNLERICKKVRKPDLVKYLNETDPIACTYDLLSRFNIINAAFYGKSKRLSRHSDGEAFRSLEFSVRQKGREDLSWGGQVFTLYELLGNTQAAFNSGYLLQLKLEDAALFVIQVCPHLVGRVVNVQLDGKGIVKCDVNGDPKLEGLMEDLKKFVLGSFGLKVAERETVREFVELFSVLSVLLANEFKVLLKTPVKAVKEEKWRWEDTVAIMSSYPKMVSFLRVRK